MPGHHISDQQVLRYMSQRRHHTQTAAAAKAGISERSARRIEKDPQLPSQQKRERHWRTRPDPLAQVWPRVEELLGIEGILPVTIFETVQDEFGEDAVPDGVRRTLERRISRWRALNGGEKEIIFPQQHLIGRQGLLDFTVCDDLRVTIAGERFDHRLFHFRLACSGWEDAAVVLGGESFTALSEHLQDALWKLGGTPVELRSDSLSAAYRNLDADAQRDFTRNYEELCRHYGMCATRNNRGEAHENGSIEGAHAHLKRRLDQALRRRGSRDFASLEDYRRFVEAQVGKQNRRRASLVEEERRVLKPLPPRRTTDFTLVSADVTRNSTISVDRVTYSVPSRLIGRHLHAHLYDDRVEFFLGPDRVMITRRVRVRHPARGHSIDFRHFVANLKRKPQALRYLVYRDALFPTYAYARAWQALDAARDARQACRDMVALLDIAARGNCVDALALRIDAALDAGGLPDIEALKSEFLPTLRARDDVTIPPPDILSYNRLLVSAQVQA
ncbi:IS21 family transposase [Sphingomonas oryzagri]